MAFLVKIYEKIFPPTNQYGMKLSDVQQGVEEGGIIYVYLILKVINFLKIQVNFSLSQKLKVQRRNYTNIINFMIAHETCPQLCFATNVESF